MRRRGRVWYNNDFISTFDIKSSKMIKGEGVRGLGSPGKLTGDFSKKGIQNTA